MFALLSMCDPDNGTCYPSLSTIAKIAKCERRTAITALQWLCALGWVSVTPRWRVSDRGDGERQRTNLYRLQVPPSALPSSSSSTSSPPPPQVRRVEESSAPPRPLARVMSEALATSPLDAAPPAPPPAAPPPDADASPELCRREEIRATLASFPTLAEFSEGLDAATILDDVAQRNGKGLAAVRKALAELDEAIRLDGGAWPRAKKASKLKTFVENVRPEPEKKPSTSKTAESKPTEPETPHLAWLAPEQKDQVVEGVRTGGRALLGSLGGLGTPPPPRPKTPS